MLIYIYICMSKHIEDYELVYLTSSCVPNLFEVF